MNLNLFKYKYPRGIPTIEHKVASSHFLVAIPFNFETQKLIQKWAAKKYQLKNAFNDFAV